MANDIQVKVGIKFDATTGVSEITDQVKRQIKEITSVVENAKISLDIKSDGFEQIMAQMKEFASMIKGINDLLKGLGGSKQSIDISISEGSINQIEAQLRGAFQEALSKTNVPQATTQKLGEQVGKSVRRGIGSNAQQAIQELEVQFAQKQIKIDIDARVRDNPEDINDDLTKLENLLRITTGSSNKLDEALSTTFGGQSRVLSETIALLGSVRESVNETVKAVSGKDTFSGLSSSVDLFITESIAGFKRFQSVGVTALNEIGKEINEYQDLLKKLGNEDAVFSKAEQDKIGGASEQDIRRIIEMLQEKQKEELKSLEIYTAQQKRLESTLEVSRRAQKIEETRAQRAAQLALQQTEFPKQSLLAVDSGDVSLINQYADTFKSIGLQLTGDQKSIIQAQVALRTEIAGTESDVKSLGEAYEKNAKIVSRANKKIDQAQSNMGSKNPEVAASASETFDQQSALKANAMPEVERLGAALAISKERLSQEMKLLAVLEDQQVQSARQAADSKLTQEAARRLSRVKSEDFKLVEAAGRTSIRLQDQALATTQQVARLSKEFAENNNRFIDEDDLRRAEQLRAKLISIKDLTEKAIEANVRSKQTETSALEREFESQSGRFGQIPSYEGQSQAFDNYSKQIEEQFKQTEKQIRDKSKLIKVAFNQLDNIGFLGEIDNFKIREKMGKDLEGVSSDVRALADTFKQLGQVTIDNTDDLDRSGSAIDRALAKRTNLLKSISATRELTRDMGERGIFSQEKVAQDLKLLKIAEDRLVQIGKRQNQTLNATASLPGTAPESRTAASFEDISRFSQEVKKATVASSQFDDNLTVTYRTLTSLNSELSSGTAESIQVASKQFDSLRTVTNSNLNSLNEFISRLSELRGRGIQGLDPLLNKLTSLRREFVEASEVIAKGQMATKIEGQFDSVIDKLRVYALRVDRISKVRITNSDDLIPYATLVNKANQEFETLNTEVSKQVGLLQALTQEGKITEQQYDKLLRRIKDASAAANSAQSRSTNFGADNTTNVRKDFGDELKAAQVVARQVSSEFLKQQASMDVIGQGLKRGGDAALAASDRFKTLASETKKSLNAIYQAEDAYKAIAAAGIPLSAQQTKELANLQRMIPLYQSQAAQIQKSSFAVKNQTDNLVKAFGGWSRYSHEIAKTTVSNIAFINSGIILGSALMAIRTSFRELIKESEQFARVLTVLQSVNMSFDQLSRTLTEKATRAAMEFGDTITNTSEVIKQFGSAGFTAEESFAALDSTMRVITATQAGAETTARNVAGLYRVFGSELKKTRTEMQAFARINDVLTSVYQNHQAELEELNQGFKFVASAAKLAGISFEDSAAMLAVLNDNMIKSGAAGRGLQVVMAQMAAKSSQFAKAFGVTIDPNKGLRDQFLAVLQAVNTQMKQGSLTVADLDKRFKLFGLRGARVFQTLAEKFDDLKKAMNETNNESDGLSNSLSLIVRTSASREFEGAKQALLGMGRELMGPVKDGIVVISELVKGARELMQALGPLTGIITTIVMFAAVMVSLALSVRGTGLAMQYFGNMVKTSVSSFGGFNKVLDESGKRLKRDADLKHASAAATQKANFAQGGYAISSGQLGSAVRDTNKTQSMLNQTMAATPVAAGKASKGMRGLMGVVAGFGGGGPIGLAIVGIAALVGVMSHMSGRADEIKRSLEGAGASIREYNKDLKGLATFEKELKRIRESSDIGAINAETAGQLIVNAYDKVGTSLISNGEIIVKTNQQIGDSMLEISKRAEAATDMQRAFIETQRELKKNEITTNINKLMDLELGGGPVSVVQDVLSTKLGILSPDPASAKEREQHIKRIDEYAAALQNSMNAAKASNSESILMPVSVNGGGLSTDLGIVGTAEEANKALLGAIEKSQRLKNIQLGVVQNFREGIIGLQANAKTAEEGVEQVEAVYKRIEKIAGKDIADRIRNEIEAATTRREVKLGEFVPKESVNALDETFGLLLTIKDVVGTPLPDSFFNSTMEELTEVNKRANEAASGFVNLRENYVKAFDVRTQRGGSVLETLQGALGGNQLLAKVGNSSLMKQIAPGTFGSVQDFPDLVLPREELIKSFTAYIAGIGGDIINDKVIKEGFGNKAVASLLGSLQNADLLSEEALKSFNWAPSIKTLGEGLFGDADESGNTTISSEKLIKAMELITMQFTGLDKESGLVKKNMANLFNTLGAERFNAIIEESKDKLADFAEVALDSLRSKNVLNDIAQRDLAIKNLRQQLQLTDAIGLSQSDVVDQIRDGIKAYRDTAASMKVLGTGGDVSNTSVMENQPEGVITAELAKSRRKQLEDTNRLTAETIAASIEILTKFQEIEKLQKDQRIAILKNNNAYKIQNAILAQQVNNGQSRLNQIRDEISLSRLSLSLKIKEDKITENNYAGFRNSSASLRGYVELLGTALSQYEKLVDAVAQETSERFKMLADIDEMNDHSENKLKSDYRIAEVLARIGHINKGIHQAEKVAETDAAKGLSMRNFYYRQLIDASKELFEFKKKEEKAESKLNDLISKRGDLYKQIRDIFRGDSDMIADPIRKSLEELSQRDLPKFAAGAASALGVDLRNVLADPADAINLIIGGFKDGTLAVSDFGSAFDRELSVFGPQLSALNKDAEVYNNKLKEIAGSQITRGKQRFERFLGVGDIDKAQGELDRLQSNIDDLTQGDSNRGIELRLDIEQLFVRLEKAAENNIQDVKIKFNITNEAQLKMQIDSMVERLEGVKIDILGDFNAALGTDTFKSFAEGTASLESAGFLLKGVFTDDVERANALITGQANTIKGVLESFGKSGKKLNEDIVQSIDMLSRIQDRIQGKSSTTSVVVTDNDTKFANEAALSLPVLTDIKDSNKIIAEQASRPADKIMSATALIDQSSHSTGTIPEVKLKESKAILAASAATTAAVLAINTANAGGRFVFSGGKSSSGNNPQTVIEEARRRTEGSVNAARVDNVFTELNFNDALTNKDKENLKRRSMQVNREWQSLLDSMGKSGEELISRSPMLGFFLGSATEGLTSATSNLTEFLFQSFVPEFAKANAEVYRSFVQNLAGIERAFNEQFDSANMSIKRNQQSYFDYLNAIEDAENQRTRARLDAERQYRESLRQTGQVFAEMAASPVASVFSSVTSGIQGVASSASSSMFDTSTVNTNLLAGSLNQILASTKQLISQERSKEIKDKDGNITQVGGNILTADASQWGKQAMEALKVGAAGFGSLIGNGFFSIIGSVAGLIGSGIAEIIQFTLNTEDSGRMIVKFIEKFVAELPEAAVRFTEILTENIGAIMASVGEAAPVLVQALVDNLPIVFQAIVDSLRDTLPAIVSAIGDGLPLLIQSLAPIIVDLIVVLLDNIPELIAAFIGAIPVLIIELIKALPKILFAIVKAIVMTVILGIKAIIDGLKKAFSPGSWFGRGDDNDTQSFHSGGVIKGQGNEVLINALTGEGILSRRGMDAVGGPTALSQLNAGQQLTSAPASFTIPALTSSDAGAGMQASGASKTNASYDNSQNSVNMTVDFKATGNEEYDKKMVRHMAEKIDQELSRMRKDRRSESFRNL